MHRLLSTAALTTVAADLRQNDVSALYAAIGEGLVTIEPVEIRLYRSRKEPANDE